MKKLLALGFVLAVLGRSGTVPVLAAPATLNPTADAYVYSTSSTSNYGSATTLRSGFWVEFQQKFISLLKFDLSSLPDDAIITSAELKLYMSSGMSSGTMAASRNTEDWAENSVNWSTRPSNDDPRATALVSSGSSYIPWDVTALVEDWFTGDHTNYGFSIVATAQETDFSADFFSREASGNQPELVISYDRPLPTSDTETDDETDPDDEAVPADETPPTTPSEPVPGRPAVVEEETPSSGDEPLVISPATSSATPSAALVGAATPSARPTSSLVRALQIIFVGSGFLLLGVVGYVVYTEMKKRKAQKEQKIEDQIADPEVETPDQG